MKRITPFFFVLFLYLQVYTQNNQNWTTDLDTLQYYLLQKDYLFVNMSKNKFKKSILKLKKNFNNNEELNYWNLDKLLNKFKISNLEISLDNFVRFPFEIKQFQDKYYITSINLKNEKLLGFQLLKINNHTLTNIINDKEINNINIKSFLEFNKITSNNNIALEVLSDDNKKQIINLTIDNNVDIVNLKPKTKAFYLQKKNRWYWQYGINFGQQVYFKFNVGLSKEFIDNTMDSLAISEITISKQYKIPLQTIYDAPSFDDFTDKLFLKFKKRRYKKLFIDFRNMKSANDLIIDKFISKLKKSRINKRGRLFLFVDESVSSTVIKMIEKLKSKTKASIIGETIKGCDCNTNKVLSFYLPNTRYKIYYPIRNFKTIVITPKIPVIYTFSQYINGIDPIMQAILNN